MGTRWSVQLVASRDVDLRALHVSVQARLDRVVQQMSTWEPDADINRYNRLQAGHWFPLPHEFAHVIACALDIADASNGAFDPTVGSLVGLWGFGAQAAIAVPDAHAIAQAHAHTGWQHISLRDGRLLQPGGVQLDLSAIAKGYGADQVASALRETGIDAALVDVGGELMGFGHKPDGTPWRVLVEAGEEEIDHSLPARVVTLQNRAIATSGDRWHHYTRGGRRYTHTLDPRCGAPVEHAAAAVSVIADCAMRADAWATALTVMGVDAGFAFAEQHQLAARFLWPSASGMRERMTAAFQQHLAP